MKLMYFLLSVFLFCSCGSDDIIPEEKPDKPNKEQELNKPKIMWFDAEANFERFASRDSISYYLDKTKEAGFNAIVVDVKPIYGDVLYSKTTFMEPLTKINGKVIERDWDYLQYFIDEARKRDLKVSVSCHIFTVGRPDTKEGPVYRSNKWDGMTAIEHTSKGMIDSKDDPSKVAVFLSPHFPEVREYALRFINEIIENYDFDAFILDYCRFSGIETDFSETARLAFEAYIGETVANFPSDIFHWEGNSTVFGKHAKKWFEFRAMVIHDFVEETKNSVKQIKPKIELQYWAGSWHHALYTQGQNWGSKNYDPSIMYPQWASAGYKEAGFAEHLDVFLNGAYLSQAHGLGNNESIEYALAKGKKIIDGDCRMYGSISAASTGSVEDGAYLCLKETGGLMVFDIVHVIHHNLWEKLKNAIDRYKNELAE